MGSYAGDFFPFGSTWIQGGGVGVDAFFVISGYLMTSIIYKGIYLNHWSWQSVFDFYIARAKRIIPALAFLCAILLAIGFPILFSSEYQKLSK